MRLEVGKVDELERGDVAGFEHHAGGAASVERLLPALHAQAPFVAILQSGELVLGTRGAEVVPARLGKSQEGIRNYRADSVQSQVFCARAAVTVPVKTCHRAGATAFKRASKDVGAHTEDHLMRPKGGQGTKNCAGFRPLERPRMPALLWLSLVLGKDFEDASWSICLIRSGAHVLVVTGFRWGLKVEDLLFAWRQQAGGGQHARICGDILFWT